ncbi:2,6-beta-D-fructofuranosidase [Prevotella herbatica]|uniref:2,6-beta-D-fructofuranosidase n=2 Tax=Prevotella herbatica TaxID=2801997 RepID=A0ABM7NW67_9BACT|nr:2,6-beta-D-fructofuranosidase [Prevotella herbatica]
MFLSSNHVLYRLDTKNYRYLLLPVEDRAEMSNIKVLANNNQVKTINVRLASEYADYYVPLDLSKYAGHELILDIHINGNIRNEGAIKEWACWKQMKYSDTFDIANREKFRPEYHHTPAYGWMNDPNGMFYKDGTWHLYFQHNPYGSLWENMTWGHSSSKDLVHWKYEGDAIEPDALGTIFSGSAVVDKNNTAGFGKGAIVAMYTSAGENQTQSLAFSTDNGKTFTKYAANPVITSNVPDFRDPHMFWNDDIKKWNLILAAGQEMNIYTSDNLKDWKFESSFGHGYGDHNGVWECPDLMKLKVRGTNKDKWMLICNINPGGPFGGSATQYFVGDFDGHKFTCESAPDVTKWMDYGKDHYATVTFDNAPEGRHVAMAWMNNWQYAAQTPTTQYRSANTVPRDLDLFEYEGQTYCGVIPSKELIAMRGKKQNKLSNACELVLNIKGSSSVTLSNDKGEKVVLTYNESKRTFSMDRTKSGKVDFSEAFPVTTTAPVYGKLKQLRIFIDNSSIEVFDAEGKMAMTNLVFPITPYNKIVKKGKIKYAIYKM